MRKSVDELLHWFKDINAYYNSSVEYQNLQFFVNKIIEDIADYAGGYMCTNSLELEADILKEFKIHEVQESYHS